MHVRGVIFDLGGTLCARQTASHEEQNAQALRHWLGTRGVQVDDGFAGALINTRQRIFDSRGSSGRELLAVDAFRPIMHQYNAPDDPDFLAEAEAAFFTPELEAMQPLPGALELLRYLHEIRIVAGLASNASSHYFVSECCRRLQFARYLDPIMTSAAVGWTKPNPRIFQAVLAHWSLSTADVVMVGDTLEADILGAHRLGIRTILLTAQHHVPDIYRHGGAPAEECSPDAAVDSLIGVGQLIDRWR
jgi:HAD superfamily hydrolase (TIGR01509 family)